ncbi:MAG: anthranilate phosphoribosyltransferase, partial [Candidatus Omnitrophica bacterium]|nr:anthranilate phosphoribosyltransferase [Candidatus Omnitrophota bacterium]
MIKEAINKLTNRKNLNFEESKRVFEEIFDHQSTFSQTAAFLTSLKMKGEVEDEIFAAATVIRERANKLNVLGDTFLGLKDKAQQIMDTCGTGGSGLNKFNISTAVGF